MVGFQRPHCFARLGDPAAIVDHLTHEVDGQVFNLNGRLGDRLGRIAYNGDSAMEVQSLDSRRGHSADGEIFGDGRMREH